MGGKLVTFMLFATTALTAFADIETYYLPQELDTLSNGKGSSYELLDLAEDISRDHLNPLGYSHGAKPAIYGSIDLEKDSQGYFIKDVYCNKKIRNRVGPGSMPHNNVMNTEHTWPQSKGAGREPFRGDIHHLFPTDSRANSFRGNSPFGEVEGEPIYFGCESSRRGSIIDPETGYPTGQRGYEPPPEHRGNVARALFYASTAYGRKITELEEFYLRKWHEDDPVDEKEMKRNNAIEASQGNRNPYIDFPNLVDFIEDF